MREWRRLCERRPVPAFLGDLVPVGGVAERRQTTTVDSIELRRRTDQPRHDDDDHQQDQDCRQEPPKPPAPERDQVDSAGSAGFGEQQRGDQEARQREEQIHTEEPAGEQVAVEQQHRQHCHAPQAVERRQVSPLAVGTPTGIAIGNGGQRERDAFRGAVKEGAAVRGRQIARHASRPSTTGARG